jgi:hypothetical protein
MPKPKVQEDSLLAEMVVARSSPAPVATPGGRPFIRDDAPRDEIAQWMPQPPLDGDPVYCCGVRVGTFHGIHLLGEWYIETVPTREMPAEFAAHVRANCSTGI